MDSPEAISVNVDITPLGEDDLSEILELLRDNTSQCYNIGSCLKLNLSLLDKIEKEAHSTALRKIISNWILKNYNVGRFGEPTWKGLVEAVAASNGGNSIALAQKIAADHQAGGSQIATTSVVATDALLASASESPASERFPPPQMGEKDPNFFQSASDQKVEVDGWGSKKLKFERYPHEPKDASTSIKFSFGAINMQPGEKRSIAGAYDMKCWPHGVAVVINNEVFIDKQKRGREGTQVDEKNLVQVLRRLGYVVEVYRDCNAQKIVDILEENRQRDHWSYDSFICCILSHGKLGHIYGSDSVAIPLDEVTARLNGDNCKSLAKKPKMFFMQACRGVLKDTGVEADDDEMEPEPRVLSSSGVRVATDSDSKIPAAEDFYFGYATANGHVAWRDLDNGSWYISELCRSLASYSKFASLNDMMTITNKRVGTTYTHADYKQSTESTTRLSSDVFFF